MADSAPAADSAAPAMLPEGDLSLEDARDFIFSLENPDAHQNIIEEEPPEEEARRDDQGRFQKSSKEVEADPEQPDPRAEQTQEDEPAESDEDAPPIDPPRSWTKEEKEAFSSWPREAQEAVARVASTREADFRRSQNELADQRKAVEAEREAMARARSEYESKVPTLVRSLEDALQAEFGDIRTLQDVTKLQAEDPFRFQQWQIHQMKINAAKAEQEAVDKQKVNEEQTNWSKHVQKESDDFANSLSEQDRGKLKEWNAKAPDFLREKGFTDTQLNELANGKLISIYDHRVQSLILDGMKYQAIASAPKAVAQKPIPTVQKPGTVRVSSVDADLKALSNRLDQSGSEEDAWALLEAKTRASTRRR